MLKKHGMVADSQKKKIQSIDINLEMVQMLVLFKNYLV